MSQVPDADLTAHVPRIYRVALRMMGRADDAREVVQEACLKALRAAGGFDGRAALATWLHRITVNCARDHLRKRQRTARDHVPLDAELGGMLTSLEASPADRAERGELYRIASTLVARLPDDCRTAFVLTQLDGYSYDEAAAIAGEPRGTIASRVYRARKILIGQMSHPRDGDSP